MDYGIATIDHVLRALAVAATGIDIAAHKTRTLLRQETLQIGVLAGKLIAGRQVEDDVCPSQCKIATWRYR